MAKKKRRERRPSKYRYYVKIGNKPDGSALSVTYHSSNLLSFVRFLDIHYKTWTYFNVYLVKDDSKVGQFTKFNRPRSKWITEEFVN